MNNSEVIDGPSRLADLEGLSRSRRRSDVWRIRRRRLNGDGQMHQSQVMQVNRVVVRIRNVESPFRSHKRQSEFADSILRKDSHDYVGNQQRRET